MTHKIFVYGTLMRHQMNNWRLQGHLGGAWFHGDARTIDSFRMTADIVPYVSYYKKGSKIVGEVWEVESIVLNELDKLEGHPNFYCRKRAKVQLRAGRKVNAWVYFCDKFEGKWLVEDGNFARYVQWVEHNDRYWDEAHIHRETRHAYKERRAV